MTARVGIGYDSHRFAAGRRLVLGGVAMVVADRPERQVAPVPPPDAVPALG